MPVPFWKTIGKGKAKADGSSASESGDSPTSTTSPQSQIPDPIDDSRSGQPSSSRRNEPTHPLIPAIGSSITKRVDGHIEEDIPLQPVVALDYQPTKYRDLPPSASSKLMYSMPVPNPQTAYDDLYNRPLDSYKFGSPSITTMTDTSSQTSSHSSQEEFPHPGADTTPRPSLAVHPDGIRNHLARISASAHPLPPTRHRPGQSDASSTHTFGVSTSASASVSSLASPGGSGLSQSEQDASQDQSSDDEPHYHYHRAPYLASISSTSSVNSSFPPPDFDDFEDDDLSDFDISSAQQDDSGSFDEIYRITPPDQDSFIADYLSQRRGSNPIPIPGAQDGHVQGREREDSVATVKYPMTSAPGPSRIDRVSLASIAPDSTSLPAHDTLWDQRMQALSGRRDSPITARSPIHPMDYDSAPMPHFTHPFETPTSQQENDGVALEFDPNEWNNIAFGIKGGADLGDVDAAPLEPRNARGPWPWSVGNESGRRGSLAPTLNDTFQKHAMAYKDQDWSFRRDKADGSALAKKRRGALIPFNERPRGPPWRGMAIGQTELWRNDLTGIYKVERLEIPAGENRPPQQRLSIHHLRDGTRQAQRPTPGLLHDPHNGPTTTIHKHSKAAAFSLSRHYRDKTQSRSGDRRPNQQRVQPLRNAVYINGKKTAMILLAPRRVQEAYTSTTTTRKLESHGLLGDAYRSRDIERWKRLVEEDDKLKEKQKLKEKAKREKELEKQRKVAEEKARKEKTRTKVKGQDSSSQGEPTGTDSGTPSGSPPTAPTSPSVAPGRVASDVDTPSNKAKSPAPSAPPLNTRIISSASSGTVSASETAVSPHELGPAPANPKISDPSAAAVSPTSPRAVPRIPPTAPPPQLQSSVSGHALINPPDPLSRDYYHSEEQEEEDIDEEDEQLGLVPRRRKRTPHNEAYNSLSPESIDSFAAQQDSHSRGFLPWFSGRNASSRTLGHEAPYIPPWLSAPSRPNNHEMQMQVVAGLNTSFQGVGLLPTDKEIRESRRRRAMKSQSRDATRAERRYTREKDIFIDLPDDALYMLLPLWPSETDPISSRDHAYELPTIPIHERLYALVYYKPWYPPDASGKSKSKDKTKRSRGSPTASQDGVFMDERNVLMNQFYIGARIVAYDDLEGSNVRVPELGLSVVGPLEESLATIPTNKRPAKSKKSDKKGKGKDGGQEREFWDFIIGSYHSRDHPMEFYPEGFKRMGLATQEAIEPVAIPEVPEVPENVAGPSRLNGTHHVASNGESSGSGSIKGPANLNASTTSLPYIPPGSARSSRADVNEIAPFGEPGPSDGPAPIIRFPQNSEEVPILENPIILTPIGRAVLEMAYMGALAVTGFAPQPYW